MPRFETNLARLYHTFFYIILYYVIPNRRGEGLYKILTNKRMGLDVDKYENECLLCYYFIIKHDWSNNFNQFLYFCQFLIKRMFKFRRLKMIERPQ